MSLSVVKSPKHRPYLRRCNPKVAGSKFVLGSGRIYRLYCDTGDLFLTVAVEGNRSTIKVTDIESGMGIVVVGVTTQDQAVERVVEKAEAIEKVKRSDFYKDCVEELWVYAIHNCPEVLM